MSAGPSALPPLLLLLLAGACATPPAPRAQPGDLAACDPVMTTRLLSKREGPVVRLEVRRTRFGCSGEDEELPLELVARIRAMSGRGTCPVGERLLRVWNLGLGNERQRVEYLSTLDPQHLAAVLDALPAFAHATDAYVIACPTPTTADWLLVESNPREAQTRAKLFVGNRLIPDGDHPAVAWGAGEFPAVARIPPPTTAP